MPMIRPAEVCRGLLGAGEASEGRRRRRKRDTTPDAIGLGIRRRLLELAVDQDPDPAAFEAWLSGFALEPARLREGSSDGSPPSGAVRAMASAILAEWRLAHESPAFHAWLARGAPSADADRDG